VLAGNEWDRINREGKNDFLQGKFFVTRSSDRMGYKLKGASIFTNTNYELVSSGVDFGAIQLLPNGELIVLMADHQTTGGYPRAAHIIKAHRGKLAQYKEGHSFVFRMVDMQTAERLLLAQEQHLTILKNGCTLKWNEYFK